MPLNSLLRDFDDASLLEATEMRRAHGIGGDSRDGGAQPVTTGGGGNSIPFLSSLLSPFGDSEELNGMGDLFRTLLAFQNQQGPQEGDIFSLFSGIQL